jgi:hypothetical protein
MNLPDKKHKKPLSLMGKIVLSILLATSLQAQLFDKWEVVPSKTDHDFKVTRSSSKGYYIQSTKETRDYYMTVVVGQGKLTKSQVNPDGAILLTVEGLKDHAAWLVLRSASTSYAHGVRFWHVGDIIELRTETTLINDDRIPAVQGSDSTVINTTRRNCGPNGCWIGHEWQK